MFNATNGKGFHMTFANGNTISVQWGCVNYCENREKVINMTSVNLFGYELKSATAEVATWDADGNWNIKKFIPDNDDDVKGYLTADEVLALMIKVAK